MPGAAMVVRREITCGVVRSPSGYIGVEGLAVAKFVAEAVRGDAAELDEDAAGEPGEAALRIGEGQAAARQEDDLGFAGADDTQAERLGVVRAWAGRDIGRDGVPEIGSFRSR